MNAIAIQNGRHPRPTPPAPEMAVNPEAELAALGTAIISPKSIDEFERCGVLKWMRELAENDVDDPGASAGRGLFASPANSIIFGILLRMRRNGVEINLTTVAAHLQGVGRLDAIGGAVYLASLEDGVFSVSQLPDLIDCMLRAARSRLLSVGLASIASDLSNPRASIERLRDEILDPFAEMDRPALPRVFRAGELLDEPLPPLEFLVQGIWPRRGGKWTHSAPAKSFKTWQALQFGLSVASGHCAFLGFQIGAPARVLYVQAELGDVLVQARVRALIDDAPEWIDTQRALSNFSVLSVSTGALNLSTDAGRATLSALAEEHTPDAIILDPLAMLFPGLIENAAEEMGGVLRFLGDIALMRQVSILLIHHAGKNGVSRGSSAFEAWGEADTVASFADPDDSGILKVTGRLRCASYEGPWFWRSPAPGALWMAPMPEGWQPDKPASKTKPPTFNPALAVLCLQSAGQTLGFKDLIARIMDAGSCSRSRAAEILSAAAGEGLVLRAAGRYSLPLSTVRGLSTDSSPQSTPPKGGCVDWTGLRGGRTGGEKQ